MYATVSDLRRIFGEREMDDLAGDNADGTVNDARLADAIAYAGSEVDSYVSARYPTPLAAPVPDVVMLVTADIVRYRLTSGDVDEKDAVVRRYKGALAWLRGVSTGSIALPVAPATPTGGVEFYPGSRALGDW